LDSSFQIQRESIILRIVLPLVPCLLSYSYVLTSRATFLLVKTKLLFENAVFS